MTHPDIQAPDWKGYYEWEAGQKRFLPGEEPSETMRVEFVFRLLDGVVYDRPLDAGCGNGYLASRVAERVEQAYGTDLSLARLRDASDLFPKVRFTRASIFDQPFPDGAFDLVSAVEVVEHLETPDRAIHELKRLSSRWVLVTVPYRGKLDLLYCPHCNTPYYHDGHVQSFDEERLSGMVTAAGLTVRKLETYVPYYPPKMPPLSMLPKGMNLMIRGAFEALGMKERVRPKYIGVLAEK